MSGTVQDPMALLVAKVALLDAKVTLLIGLSETTDARMRIVMSETENLATEVAAWKASMINLHTAITDIQSRLEAALAAAAANVSDPTALTDMHMLNAELKAAITGMAPGMTQPTPPPVVTPVP